jgi:hypothetical protein
VLHGRGAGEVIDELEALFGRAYAERPGDDGAQS